MTILIQNGADFSQGVLLAEASRRGWKTTTQVLLDNGADVNAQGERENTALHYGSLENYKAIV